MKLKNPFKLNKSASADFTEASKPISRQAMFGQLLKSHYRTFLGIGALCLLFSLVFFASVVLSDMFAMAIVGIENEIPKDGQIFALSFMNTLVSGGTEVIGCILMSVCLAGIFRIFRNLIWEEPVFFWDDFKQGVKMYGGRFALTATLWSVNKFLIALINLFASSNELLLIFTMIISALFWFFITPLFMWTVMQSLFYSGSLFSQLKNSTALYGKTFLITICLLAAAILPITLTRWFVGNLVVRYFLIILLILLAFAPAMLGWLLYACHVFDKYINKVQYPEIYRKGLCPEEYVPQIKQAKRDARKQKKSRRKVAKSQSVAEEPAPQEAAEEPQAEEEGEATDCDEVGQPETDGQSAEK